MKFFASSVLVQAAFVATWALAVAPGCESTPKRGCDAGEKRVNGECTEVPAVFVDSVGYLPKRKKVATFIDQGDKAFEVRSAADDSVVFEGTASDAVLDPDTNENLRQADFSDLEKSGEYYIEVPGTGHSPKFRIGNDVFDGALHTAMLGMYGQRCGVKVDIETDGGHFTHDECHLEEASLTTIKGQSGTKDDTGGWHDAGDYGKYVNNGAFAVAFLLKAFEHFPERLEDREFQIPEAGDDVPDILDEARVEIEWLLKTQLDDGSVAHKVTATGFEGVIMPEDDSAPRFFVPIGTVATADFVAITALAARIYAPYDEAFSEKCLEASQKSYAFLQENPDIIEPDQSGFTTGGYNNGDDQDERMWAAAELFETTGDADVLADFETRAQTHETMDTVFDWANVRNLALTTYLFSTRDGRQTEIVSAIQDSVLSAGDALVTGATEHGYGRALRSLYYWGINGVVARTSFNLAAAYRVEPDAKYLDALQAQLDHVFGRNPYGRSYVTAVGFDPPKKPHHRPSQADTQGLPWPGLLVGGPHGTAFGDADKSLPPALTWSDDESDYFHNEIAINWNTALIYALVAIE